MTFFSLAVNTKLFFVYFRKKCKRVVSFSTSDSNANTNESKISINVPVTLKKQSTEA
jgi:hypothetical protein